MFCLKTSIRNIQRHKSKSMLVVLICMLTVIFVFIYMDGIRTNERQLSALAQSIPVHAQIRNINGSQEVGLQIREELIQSIESSGQVKDLHYSAQLMGSLDSGGDTKNPQNPCSIRGVNDIQAISNLQEKQIKLADGADAGFLRGKDALCLADESFLQRNNLNIGDTVNLTLYKFEYPNPESSIYTLKSLGESTLRIAGSISRISTGTDPVDTDLFCPAGWVKEKHVQANEKYYLDSASFTVADPLNLNAFKEAMSNLYMISVNPTSKFNIWGDALRVKDEIFISAAGRLKSNLAVLYSFAAIVYTVIALVGYAIAYLLMQGRRTDIAIMRSLGTSRKACVMIMLMEFAMLGLAGCLLGMTGAFIWLGPAWSTLLYALLFFASLLLGIGAAALQLSRSNTMTGLTKTEA